MSEHSSFDASIPVLTEVFGEQAERPEVPALSSETETVKVDRNALLEADAIEGWSNHDWELMERRLSERILRQLQGRVDFVLEQRLKDSMADVLQHALVGLTAEIREGLQQTIEKIVARAVTQELTHLQTLKK